MKKKKGVIWGVIYSSGFGSIALISGIVLLPVIVGIIGAGPYGAWLFLIAISTYFSYSDLGVGTAIIHFASRGRGGDATHSLSSLVASALTWTVLIATVAIPIYAFVALNYLNGAADALSFSNETVTTLVVLASLTVGSIVLRPFSAALQGAGEFVLERKTQLVGQFVKIVGTLIACFGFGTITALAAAEALALLTPGVISMFAVLAKRMLARRQMKNMWSTLRAMTSYSGRSLSVSLTGLVILQGGTVILGIIGSPAQVTYYNAAFRIYSGVRQLNSWTVWPFQSTLSRLFATSPSAAERVVRSVTFASFGSVAIICGLLIPSISSIVELWLGGAVPVAEVSLTTAILLAGLTLNALHGPLSMASDAAGKPGVFFPVQVFWAMSFLGLGIWLAPALGTVGVAIALSAPLLVVEPVYILMSRKLLGMSLRSWWEDCLKPVLTVVAPAAFASGLTFIAVRDSPSLVLQFAPSVVFGALVLVLLWLRRSDLPIPALRGALQSEF